VVWELFNMADAVLKVFHEANAQISAQFSALNFDDSSFPYLQAVIAFIAVEYVWETYLDLRQRCDSQ
jgi:hypothetical protein